MEKQDKPIKSAFVIKLSSETVQKLQDTEQPPEEPKEALDTASESESAPESKDGKLAVSTNTDKSDVLNSDASKEENSTLSVDKASEDIASSDYLNSDASKEENSTLSVDKASEDIASSWGEYAPYVTYEGETAVYTDPTTKVEYTWSNDANSWVPRKSEPVPQDPNRTYSYENDTHVYTESDGSKFFWDDEKKAWFPKVDEDFLAQYQMSYGFVDNTTKKEEKPEPVKKAPESGALKRKVPDAPKWFDATEDKNNTKVYVSNLPDDLTEEEFVDIMQKCGLVMREPSNQKMKVKLYYDTDNNCFKGDALCTYIKIESVELALNLLDGSDIRGRKISVQRAQFQMKGDYNPALKPKKKKKKELEKLKKMQQKLFDWRPEKAVGERSKNERVVIVRNLFDPALFDKEVQLILDYQQDLREECGKCGEVRKVVLYDRHPEGVAQITMKEPEQADAVVLLINGRWFGKRKLSAEIWDGRTKFRIAETDADMNKRVDKWGKFLEGEAEDKDGAKKEAGEKEDSVKNDTVEGMDGTEKVENDPEKVHTEGIIVTEIKEDASDKEDKMEVGESSAVTTNVVEDKREETADVTPKSIEVSVASSSDSD